MKGWSAVCRAGGLGDNLLAASACRPLKKLGYNVEMITWGHCTDVFRNNPFIDKLTIKNDGDVPGGEEGTKWFAARAKEYDVFAHLSYTCEVRHAVRFNEAGFWWRPEYRRKVFGGSYLETVHDVVGVPHDFGPLFFPTDEEYDNAEKARPEAMKGPYLAWVISGSRIDKLYGKAAMAIARIIKEVNLPVLIVGAGDKQVEMAKDIRDHVNRQNGSKDGCHIMVSPGNEKEAWGIRPALTQVMIADVVVTPDTGIAWAVAFEDMPKIMLLSHASAENITKHWTNCTTLHADPNCVPCWPCHQLHEDLKTCTPDKDLGALSACINDITVEQVVENVRLAWLAREFGDTNVVSLRA